MIWLHGITHSFLEARDDIASSLKPAIMSGSRWLKRLARMPLTRATKQGTKPERKQCPFLGICEGRVNDMRLGDLDEALRMIKDSRKDNPYVGNVTATAWRMAHDSAISCVEACNTIDAVPVVRCKDCKLWHEETGFCEKHSFFIDSDGVCCSPAESPNWTMTDPNDFCSYGERKDGEG